MKYLLNFAILCFLISLPCYSLDNNPNWDGINSVKISNLQVTHGNNYGFRVETDATDLLNDTDTRHKPITWAYIDETDSNYKVYASILTLAFTMNYKVVLHVNKKEYNVANDDWLAHIGYITVHK